MKILGSLIFCVFAFAVFISVAVASRRELPLGLVELYGDVSGIRALTIEGAVRCWVGQYGYTFSIAYGRQQARMYAFNNSQAASDFYFKHRPALDAMRVERAFSDDFTLLYLPIDNAQPVVTNNPTPFSFTHTGATTPVPEYRYIIYGEVFAVTPLVSQNIPTHDHQLFIYAGPDGYIASPRQYNDRHFHPLDWRFIRTVAPTRASSLRFFETVNLGNMNLHVSTAPGLFGNTGVYSVYRPERVQRANGTWYLPERVRSVLFPITLERDEDEIIGMLPLGNSALLFINRASGIEITRLNPTTRENHTIFFETDVPFDRQYLHENSLVLYGIGNNDESIIAAFDLQNNGLSIVGVFPITHNSDIETTAVPRIQDITISSGIIYVAYTMSRFPQEHLPPVREAFVSAYDSDGRLIGHAQVLSGVEDDHFWGFDRPRRELRLLTLRK